MPRAEAPASPGVGRVVLVVGLGCVVNPLNATMIAGAYKEIAAAFGASLSDASWLVTLYLGFTAALQPVAGAIGDRFGRRGTFLAGTVGFALASAAAGFSPTLPVLIAFRCAQAISSALVIPNGLAILRDAVPEEKRGRAAGGLGAIMGLGAALGALLGALLVARGGWAAVFWFNVPLAALAAVAIAAFLPVSAPGRPEISPVALLGAALLPLAVGFELLHRAGGRGAGFALLVAAAVVAGGGILLVRRSPVARSDARLLATPAMLGAIALIAFQQLMFFASIYVLPAWLVSSLGISLPRAGAYLGLTTLLMVMLTPPAGRLADSAGVRAPALGGVLAAGAGLALLSASTSGLSTPRAILGLVLLGVGFGGAGPSLQRAALDAAPAGLSGLAMGLFQSARYLGSIAGAALLSASFAERTATVGVAEGALILRKLILWGALPSLLAALALPGKKRIAGAGPAGG